MRDMSNAKLTMKKLQTTLAIPNYPEFSVVNITESMDSVTAYQPEQCPMSNATSNMGNATAKMIHANDKSAQCNRKKAKTMPQTTRVLLQPYISNAIAMNHAKAKCDE